MPAQTKPRNPKTVKTKGKANVKKGSSKVSPALQAAHKIAKGLHDAGIMDKTTMKEFDALCVPEVPNYTPTQIKKIRTRCNASQTVFAKCLNVTPSALQKWEIGTKSPGPMARKLLQIVDAKGLDVLFLR